MDPLGFRRSCWGRKEGLALINGTQFSTAHALAGLFEAWQARPREALVTLGAVHGRDHGLNRALGAGNPRPARPARPDRVRPPTLRALLAGSVKSAKATARATSRVQDPYCIRCQPQVTGAAMDVLRHGGADAGDRGQCRDRQPAGPVRMARSSPAGTFHAEPVGFAADMIALALAEIGAIAQRRVALMVDPTLSPSTCRPS